MAVIDAIRTAIGALGEILRAMGAVLDWLKAVRRGGAGVLFAKAVAAGIVALLELAYEALLSGIGKYVAKVGRRFKGIAAKLGGKGKGDKPGGGKTAGADGADDKGGDKKPETDPLKKPGTDAKTQTATVPKPGQGKDGAPGKPKTPADAKTPTTPAAKGENGKSKDKDEKPDTKPDTKPTASPKPKPKAEPPAKPKPEPDTKPKGADPKAPDRPKDDEKTTDTQQPKNPDGKGPDRPKDQDPSKPKREGTDSSSKPRDDKDGPGTQKPKPGKEAPGKPKPGKRGPDKPGSRPGGKGPDRPRTRPEKSGPGRPKSKSQKDRRKKDEESKESKDARLRKILARLRPKVQSLLDRGTSTPTFKALLVPMRAWYRLTKLEKQGSNKFDITAVLNPQEKVVDGMDVNIADRVLLILQRLGEEYRVRSLRRGNDQAEPDSAPDSPDLPGRLAPNDLAKRADADRHQVTSGTSPYQQSGMIRSIPALTEGPTASFIDQIADGEVVASVRRTQGGRRYKNPTPDNQLVHWTNTDSEGARSSRYLSHDEFTDMLSNEMTAEQRQQLARGALENVAGSAATAGDPQNALELKHWFFDIEGWRDPSTNILTTMGLDMASRGQGKVNTPDGVVDYGDLAQFARDFPMRAKAKPGAVDPSKNVGGAVAIRKGLVRYLTKVKNFFANPTKKDGKPRARPYLNTDYNAPYEQALMRRRQLRITRAWIANMEGAQGWMKNLEALSVESPEVIEERLKELERMMRARLEALWENESTAQSDQ